jgi:hypothetical protein
MASAVASAINQFKIQSMFQGPKLTELLTTIVYAPFKFALLKSLNLHWPRIASDQLRGRIESWLVDWGRKWFFLEETVWDGRALLCLSVITLCIRSSEISACIFDESIDARSKKPASYEKWHRWDCSYENTYPTSSIGAGDGTLTARVVDSKAILIPRPPDLLFCGIMSITLFLSFFLSYLWYGTCWPLAE